MDTNTLIQQLAAKAGPVRRLAPPWKRAAIWFAISLPCAAAVILTQSINVDLRQMPETRYLIEQLAALATAVTAAAAAFRSVVPGYDRRWLLLPLAPLAVWFATLGEGCVHDFLRLGSAGLALRDDWDCLRLGAMIGIIPAIAIVAMLRRGAPLLPHATLALAAVAVAGLTNFALRLHHSADISFVILVWHFGSVAVVAFVAGLLGQYVLKWRHSVS